MIMTERMVFMFRFTKSAGAFLLSLILLLSFSGCTNAQTNEPEMQSSNQSVLSSEQTMNASREQETLREMTSSNPIQEKLDDVGNNSKTSLTQVDLNDLEAVTEIYLHPFIYQIGSRSWNSPQELDPDAFVDFYYSLGGKGGRITIPDDGPIDKEFGNRLIPEEIVEQVVQDYFDIEIDQIRKSQYYNSDKHSYCTGGIGSTVDIKATHAERNQDFLIIQYESNINSDTYQANWSGSVIVRLKEDGKYKYISYVIKNLIEKYN